MYSWFNPSGSLLHRWQRGEVELVGCALVQRRVRSTDIVEIDVARDPCLGLGDRVVSVQIYLFVFHRLPNAFDEDVVPPCPAAIHADLHAARLQRFGELVARELAALIGVEYLGFAVLAEGLLKRL